MTFASLASLDSPSPTHRAATVSRRPGKVWCGVRQTVGSLECSHQRKPHSRYCVLHQCPPASGSTGLGWKVGLSQSVPGCRAGLLPSCQVAGKAQWPYESAMLCTRTGPLTSGWSDS